METWVRTLHSHGYQVCIEKGVTEGCHSIIMRIRKDGGELRSQMAFPPSFPGDHGREVTRALRDQTFDELDSELVDAAVANMLASEPDLMDGSQQRTEIHYG